MCRTYGALKRDETDSQCCRAGLPSAAPTALNSRIRQCRLFFLWGLEAEDGHDFLQIFPDFAFCGGIAKQVRRMIGGDEFRAVVVEPLAAESGNAQRGLEHRLRGATAEATNHPGLDHAELANEIGRAGCDFVLFRQAIFGRTAFHDVADVNIRTAKAHRLDHLREEFPGAADEGLALLVFVAAGTFTDENELRLRIADAEDDVGASLVEFAARAVGADVGADALEGIAFDAFVEKGGSR